MEMKKKEKKHTANTHNFFFSSLLYDIIGKRAKIAQSNRTEFGRSTTFSWIFRRFPRFLSILFFSCCCCFFPAFFRFIISFFFSFRWFTVQTQTHTRSHAHTRYNGEIFQNKTQQKKFKKRKKIIKSLFSVFFCIV